MSSLAAVRTALKPSDSEHATYLTSLIESGKIAPSKTNPGSKTRQLFGPLDADFPRLGKRISLFDADRLPTKQELQELCLRDLKATREHFGDRLVNFAPSRTAEDATDTDEGDPSLDLITNINKDRESSSQGINHAIAFQSESLQNICNEGADKPDNVLHTSMTTCIIIPHNNLLPLHHSNEGITTTTLLSGSIVWIIWPPTNHNLSILQTFYESLAQDTDDSVPDVSRDLEGGIAFFQNEGETLRIPPFCPMMNLATKTSVFATSSTVTVTTYITMLRRLPPPKSMVQNRSQR